MNVEPTAGPCPTCRAPERRIWGPTPDHPEWDTLTVGNYIALERCADCRRLWIESPYEPYLTFRYSILWPETLDEEDWNRLHARDEGETLRQWHLHEIRRLGWKADRETRRAIQDHNERSYGHYGLAVCKETPNPIDLQDLL